MHLKSRVGYPFPAVALPSPLSSAGEFVFGATEEGAHGADDPAGEQHDDYDEDCGERARDIRMARGQPGQADGEDVFAEAERDVGEGFGRGRYGGAGGGFAAVGDKGDPGAEQRRHQLVRGRKLGGGLVGQQSGDWDADEGVEGVPEQVEGGDFVGEEFEGEEREAGDDDGPSGEQEQPGRKRHMAETGQQAEDGDGGVEIQSGGEADCGQQGEEFGGRDLQDI